MKNNNDNESKREDQSKTTREITEITDYWNVQRTFISLVHRYLIRSNLLLQFSVSSNGIDPETRKKVNRTGMVT